MTTPVVKVKIQPQPIIRVKVIPRAIIKGKMNAQIPARVEIGTVTTGDPGTSASVENAGTPGNAKLNFTIPRGEQGVAGPANTLAIGTVSDGDTADATITGTSPNQTLNLVLPKGEKGDEGEKGDPGNDGAPGVIQSIVAGDNITVDDSDPANPIVSSTGDVVGPSSSTDAHIVLFDGVTGKAIKDSGKTVGDFATAAQGVPTGGTTGQVLAKASGTDNDTEWVDPPEGGGGSARNRIINPCGRVAQAGLGSTADGAYGGFDQWYCLSQTGAVTTSQLTDVEDGMPVAMRITQSQSTAQRFGYAQVLEGAFCKDLRSKDVALAARVRCSASTTIRFAIIGWTGTLDTPTKDVINDWTSGTFTAGNFFLASNVSVVATGSLALTANTLTDIDLSGTFGSSLNNAIVLFWTDSAQAQNVTLDISNVWFGIGAAAPEIFEPPAANVDRLACQRYWQQSYAQGTAPGTNTTVGGIDIKVFSAGTSPILWTVPFVTAMRSNPSVTVYDSAGASGKIFRGSNGKTASVPFSSADSFQMQCNDTTSASEMFFQWTSDARL